jgi:hypothetical protein
VNIRAWLAVWGLALVTSAGGCDQARRTRFDCSCNYITDTDVPGSVAVSICAKDATQAIELGGDCATSLGVGLAQGCTCRTEGQPCAREACQQTAALDP